MHVLHETCMGKFEKHWKCVVLVENGWEMPWKGVIWDWKGKLEVPTHFWDRIHSWECKESHWEQAGSALWNRHWAPKPHHWALNPLLRALELCSKLNLHFWILSLQNSFRASQTLSNCQNKCQQVLMTLWNYQWDRLVSGYMIDTSIANQGHGMTYVSSRSVSHSSKSRVSYTSLRFVNMPYEF